MQTLRLALVAFTLIFASADAFAQTAVTATCKDGTSFSGTSRRGACARHGGVQAYGPADTASSVTADTPTTNGAVANPLAPSSAAAPAAGTAPVNPTVSQNPARAAPSTLAGAGGQVWVNSTSSITALATAITAKPKLVLT